MTIQIELSREEMQRLAAEAEARGIPPEVYAQKLVRDAIGTFHNPDGRMSVEEFHEMLKGMAEGSENLPVLSESAFARESFYEDDE